MTTLTPDIFWGFFADFVRYHAPDAEEPCKQLQTWAVLKNLETNLNDPALGMTIRDKDRGHFYSRAWAKANYNPNRIECKKPPLVASILDIQITRINASTKEIKYNFDLAAFDVLRSPKGKSGPCESRTEIDIFQDCNRFIGQAFDFLDTIQKADIGGETVWKPEGLLNYWVAQAVIGGYTTNEQATRQFRHNWKQQTKQARALPWRGGLDGLFGVYVPDLSFTLIDCDQLELDFSQEYTTAINERE